MQAYHNFERPNVDGNKAPLTMQEAQEIRDLYTAVERDLSENLEVLSDGTHRVTFSKEVNAVLGGMGLTLGDFREFSIYRDSKYNRLGSFKSEEEIRYGLYNSENFHPGRVRIESLNNEAWYKGNDEFMDFLFKSHPQLEELSNKKNLSPLVYVQEEPDVLRISIKGPHYQFVFHRYRMSAERRESARPLNHVRIFKDDLRLDKVFDLPNTEGEIRSLVDTAMSHDREELNHFLKWRSGGANVKWIENSNYFMEDPFFGYDHKKVTIDRFGRVSRLAGRWGFQAVLAIAGIVGTHILFDHAQGNPEETPPIAIEISKEQWDNLGVAVREQLAGLSAPLNELELYSKIKKFIR